MAVTFLLPSERPVGVVGFTWSPRLEVALSLRPLVHPKRHPMHLPSARRCRDLPDDLRDEIRPLTSGFQGSLPGVFEVGLRGDLPSFDDELASFAALDEELFLSEWSLADGGASCSMDAAADRAVVALLRRYWDAAFRDEWDRIQPRLEAEVTDGARALVTTGMPGLVAEFLPGGRWDPDTRPWWWTSTGNGRATSPPAGGCCWSRPSMAGPTSSSSSPNRGPWPSSSRCVTCACGRWMTRPGCRSPGSSPSSRAPPRSSPPSSACRSPRCHGTSSCWPRPAWSPANATATSCCTGWSPNASAPSAGRCVAPSVWPRRPPAGCLRCRWRPARAGRE